MPDPLRSLRFDVAALQERALEAEEHMLATPIRPMPPYQRQATPPPEDSFRIVRNPAGGRRSIRILKGNEIVIHISAHEQAEQTHSCADATTEYFYVTYTYATDTWAWTLGALGYPAEDPSRRLFRIGWVTTAGGFITRIHNDRVGDLEVYAQNC